MTTFSNKAELIQHLEDPKFVSLLSVKSADEVFDCGYVDVTVDPEEYAGAYLFDTPVRGNGAGGRHGTWISVIKLFGDNDYPFRVIGDESTPWGNGMDDDSVHLGDFRTLGDAVDLAFRAHEMGTLELDVLIENEETGAYMKGPAKISIPELPAAPGGEPEHVLLAHSFKDGLPANFTPSGLPPKPLEFSDTEILRILELARSKGFTVTPHTQAGAQVLIQRFLLEGNGEARGHINRDLWEKHRLFVGGLATVLQDENGSLKFYDINGIKSEDEFIASITVDWDNSTLNADLSYENVAQESFDKSVMMNWVSDGESDVKDAIDFSRHESRALTKWPEDSPHMILNSAIDEFRKERQMAVKRSAEREAEAGMSI